MAKMGGSPPHFEGKNFAYWKVRMAAYLDAIAPEVWLVTQTGFTEPPTTEQLKWNARLEMQFSKPLVRKSLLELMAWT
jgi:hypothetical protein